MAGLCTFSQCAVVLFRCWFVLLLPETKGAELEDIDRLFDEFYGKKTPMNDSLVTNTTDNRNDVELDDLDELDYEVAEPAIRRHLL